MQLFEKRTHLILVVILLAVGFAAYANSFDCSFQFDDGEYVLGEKTVGLLNSEGGRSFSNTEIVRIVAYFSFSLNYFLHGPDVFGYHVVNFVIHIANAFLVWFFISLLFQASGVMRNEGKSNCSLIAYFTALIFLVHPMQTQAVTYITQRLASLVTLFYLSTLCLYFKGRMSEKGDGKYYFIAAFFITLLGMFTKENMFTLPFMIILVEICFFNGIDLVKGKVSKKHIFMCLLGFIFFLLLIPTFFGFNLGVLTVDKVVSGSHENDLLNSGVYFLTQMRVIVKYLRMLILPFGQSLDYDFPASYSLFERETLLCFLALFLAVIFALKVFKKNRLVSFGILWFFLTISVESSFIPIHHVIYDHRVYLPSIGFFLIFVYLLFQLSDKKQLIIALLSVIICIYATLTFQRNKVWKTEVSLWTDVIQKAPQKAKGYYNIANVFAKQGKRIDALSNYNQAIKLSPNLYSAYNNRGLIFQDMQRFDLALADYSAAINANERYFEAYNNRGVIYSFLNKKDLALKDFNKAVKKHRGFSDAYSNRGIIYAEQGNYDLALADFDTALQLDQEEINIYMNRATTYERMKKYELAIKDLHKVLSLDPHMLEARLKLKSLTK